MRGACEKAWYTGPPMNRDVPQIRTERLLLAIPGASAANALARFNRENQRHLAPWSPRMTAGQIDPEGCAQMLDAAVAAARQGTRYAFLVFEGPAGAAGPVVGYLNFSEIVRGAFLACYMGYALAEVEQGKGYMSEAARAGIDFIFNEVRLHRIMANYMPRNLRSCAVLQRLGFSVEGTAKAYLYLNGAWQDHVLTSLINPNPLEP